MAFIEQLKLLERIDAFIARKGTGSAKNLADKLSISRSSVFNYFDTLRQLGAEIEYCELRKSYFYANNKRPRLPTLSSSKLENFYGGKTFFNFFSPSPEFLDCDLPPL